MKVLKINTKTMEIRRRIYPIVFFLSVLLLSGPVNTQPVRENPGTPVGNSDSARSDYYYRIAYQYWQKDADSVVKYSGLALSAARHGGYLKGEANGLLSEGVGHSLKEENVRGLDCYLQALRISERLQLWGLVSNLYNNIGMVYSSMGQYGRSNQYFGQALRMTKEGDVDGKGILFTNMADNFKKLGNYDSALVCNSRALVFARAVRDSVLLSAIFLNTGEDYCGKGELSRAMLWFRRSEEMAERIHDEQDLAWAYVSMADIFSREGSYRQSIRLAGMALRNARHFSFTEVVRKSHSVLYTAYLKWKRYDSALRYRNLEIAWKDSLYGIEKDKRISELQSGYELEKKQYQLDIANQKNLMAQKEVQSVRGMHFVYAGVALFFVFWAIFLYRGNQEVSRLNRQLRARDEERRC